MAISVTGALNIANAGEINMHACNRHSVGAGAVEHIFADLCRQVWIAIKHYASVGICELKGGEMDNIAPDQQALIAGMNSKASMARRVARQGH